jgi:hypothetical protein
MIEPTIYARQPKPDDQYLAVLWLDANGKWDRAHDLADSRNDKDSAWLHAYLHRKEGDEWNARYWYNRAGRPFPLISLEEEWKVLFDYFSKLDI